MSRRFRDLIGCSKGSAAVEMALVTPLLITLLFGSFELGNYFLDNHVVAKAVRDGARYAARKSFDNYSTCSGEPGGSVASETRNLVRTGQISSGGTPRLPGWPDTATLITIEISCAATAGADAEPIYSGIYEGKAQAPIVTVSAAVPYNSLFSMIGFNSTALTLRASSQAPVMGI